MITTPEKRSREPAPSDTVLQFLVVLAGTDPLVWRRLHVPAAYTFWDLHVAVQDAMGWQDYHLHEFRVFDPRSGAIAALGIPDPDGFESTPVAADWEEQLLDYVSDVTPVMQYTYDFGDDWQHAVVFEGYESAESGVRYPQCLGGAGACPPEDCGGPHGYARFLAALGDPAHPDHSEYLEWVGESFDPLYFSAAEVSFDDPQERWQYAFAE